MTDELWRRSAVELGAMIASREVSSREVVAAHLGRIEEVNPAVNAVIESWPERSLAWADEADAAVASGARASGGPLGPLHGVPFTAKCNLDFAGSATTVGCATLADNVATGDTVIVARMRAAGAVPVGRTNMPDMGLRLSTESSLYGATHNPWDLSRTAAGSSGGEGAAIASGMSPIGLGNDIGGSLRNPAYANGVVSIKPGFGLVPLHNGSDLVAPLLSSQLMLVNGVLGRTVADVRAGLRTVAGSHASDPDVVDTAFDGPPRPRRIGLVPEPAGGSTAPAVADAVRSAGAALEAAGYEVAEMEPPRLEDTYRAWNDLLLGELRLVRPLLEGVMGEEGVRFFELSDSGQGASTAEAMLALHQTRFELAVAWRAMFEDIGALVGPTWTQPPFPLGWDIESGDNAQAVLEMIRFVLPANILNIPAACVPTGVVDGLPMGVQVIGPRTREDACLSVAADIEAAVGTITPIDPRPAPA